MMGRDPLTETQITLCQVSLVQHVLSPRCACQNILELDCLQALGIKRYTLGAFMKGRCDD
jgi:hypothetical protein